MNNPIVCYYFCSILSVVFCTSLFNFCRKLNTSYAGVRVHENSGSIPGRVAQLVTRLPADTCMSAEKVVASSILVRSHILS